MVKLTKAQRIAKKAALAAQAGTVANPVVSGNAFTGSLATPATYAAMWQFINANGGAHNVVVQALPNVQANAHPPIPFGYNGKPNGVRHTIQNWLLFGVNGNNTVAAILAAAKPLGHSAKRPNCLLALLNGGYSPSSHTWGTPFVQLVAVASQQVAA